MEKNDKILNLIIAEISENIDQKGLSELISWKNESNDNLKSYQKIYRLITKADASIKWDQVNIDLAKSNFKAKTKAKKRIIPIYYQLAAAVIALFITVSGVIYVINNVESDQEKFATIMPADAKAVLTLSDGSIVNLGDSALKLNEKISGITINDEKKGLIKYESLIELKNTEIIYNNLKVKRGQTYKLALSDGTRVQFNSESSLSYPVVFTGDKREVKLKGEAFFNVAHNPEKPFYIKTDKSSIKVLGTSFNVKVYEDEDAQITLVTGKVNIEIGEESFNLAPGQQVSINHLTNNIEINEVDVTLYTSWKDGVFKFIDLPIENIANVLSRWYDVDFEFESDVTKEERFSGAITKYRSLDYILNIIEKTNDIDFDYDYDKIIIKTKNE